MDKKKLFAIALFLIMGLFMFSYANPVSDNTSLLDDNNNNSSSETGTTANKTETTTTDNTQSTTTNTTTRRTRIFVAPIVRPLVEEPKVYALALNGKEVTTLEVGSTYTEEYAALTLNNADVTSNIEPSTIKFTAKGSTTSIPVTKVDTTVLGSYELTYIYKTGENTYAPSVNDSTKTFVTRTINVVDTTSPVITLNGENEITIEAGSEYSELGATVTDNFDEKIEDVQPTIIKYTGESDAVTMVVKTIDTTKVGTYVVEYTAKDSSNNEAKTSDTKNNKVIRTIKVVDTTAPSIELNGEAEVTLEVKNEYNELGAITNDIVDGTTPVVITGNVDTTKLGTYTLTYTTTDSHNNTSSIKRIVKVVDTTAPIIELNGDSTINVEVNTTYNELGATVTDNYDATVTKQYPIVIWDITDGKRTIVKSIDTTKLGKYRLMYLAKDSSGNQTLDKNNLSHDYVYRYVNVVDTTAPIISLNGGNITLEAGSTYTELGATMTDNYDATNNHLEPTEILYRTSMSSHGTPVTSVNTLVPGVYSLKYTCKDSSGNICELTNSKNEKRYKIIRYVTVVDTTAPTITLNGKNDITIGVNSSYKDEGATASDIVDGNVTVNVSGTVDTTKLGNYTLTYTATDSHNNTSSVTRTIHVVDTIAPVISLNGDENITVEAGSTYTELGATVTDNYDATVTKQYPIVIWDITDGNRTIVKSIDTSKVGEYQLMYIHKDSSGNQALDKNNSTHNYLYRYVHVVDTTSPSITLNGDADMTIEAGSKFVDPGVTAKDIVDGNTKVVTTGSVNTLKPGTYALTYTTTDSHNNTSSVTRTIHVIDTTAPVITLNGKSSVIVELGSTYNDASATASDIVDGNVKVNVVENTVNTNKVGTYKVVYSATDSSNNTSTSTRTVEVKDTTAPTIKLNGDARIKIKINKGYTEYGISVSDLSECNDTVIVINYTEPYGTSSEVVSSIDTKNVGTYLITYTVQDIYGNTSTVTRRLIVDQWLNEIPNIKIDEYMNGSSIGFWNDEIEINSSMPTFTARAYDYFDDKIMHYAEINQSKITIDTTALNIAKKGTYKVTFTAVDWAGNVKTVTEKIKVVDTTKPVITLDTNNLVSTKVKKDLYLNLPTAVVTDNSGEKLTAYISDYDVEYEPYYSHFTLKYHKYIKSVTYTAKDSSGNKAEYTYTLPTRYQLY